MKRHIAWSNAKTVECLNMGVMSREIQIKLFGKAPKTARTYKNKAGRKAYVGSKFLKGTQNLDSMGDRCFFVYPKNIPKHFSGFEQSFWEWKPWVYGACTPSYLRTYPPRFALKLVRLYPRFCLLKEALPEPTTNEQVGDGMDLFSRVNWDDWWDESANMKSVFAYLRGSKDLELGEWRALFPTHFWSPVFCFFTWPKRPLYVRASPPISTIVNTTTME